MFDIGWTEMLVIAVVMIVVVGPKDLPKMLRTFGKTTTKLRSMAGDFQKQFNEALREAELDDVKKSVDSLRGMNPLNEIKKQLNPLEKVAAEVRSGLDAALKPTPKPAPAVTETHTAEPLKNGATAMPGVAGPEKMPEPPVFPAKAEAPAGVADVKAAEPVKVVKPTAAPKTTSTKAKTAATNGTSTAPKTKPAAKPAAPRTATRAAKKTEAPS